MAKAIDGVQAAGMQPVWVIAESALADATLNASTKNIPLAAVTGGVKIDCYYNLGGVEMEREQQTKERQRACQKVIEEIKIGEKISGKIEAVYDQQAAADAVVNAAYTALPEGGTVYLFVAHGWDTDETPTAETKGDLWRVEIQQKDKTFAADNEAELTFIASLVGDLYLPDLILA